ncbi:MAG: tail fiber domain-containing protein [Acidobacteriota bacterium]|nr:tail fiber domain-containing protein [Acidobacteriota bacterium]
MAKHRVPSFCASFALMLAFSSLCLWAKGPKNVAETTIHPDQVTIQTAGEFKAFHVVVTGPSGRFEFNLAGDENAVLDQFTPDGELMKDGLYKYEITGIPNRVLPYTDGNRMAEKGDRYVTSGSFSILQGEFVTPYTERELADRILGKAEGGGIIDDTDGGTLDQQILDDLIVDGSACIGQDCVNGESFGFDTLRLKENNLRIKAQDTSNTASFPTVDWQLTFNDSSNGGKNKFSVDSIDNGASPFTIEYGASSSSLYLDDGGRLGLGTDAPVSDIHVKTGNTPTLRLEQDGSSGFTAQTWDLAGNEANLFFRDVTGGSDLPFRIYPGADTNALTMTGTGVGIGTNAPSTILTVQDASTTASVLIKGVGQAAQFSLENGATTEIYNFLNGSAGFRIDDNGGGAEFEINNNGTIKMGQNNSGFLTISGNAAGGDVTIINDLTVSGTIFGTVSSDINMKKDFQVVDPVEVLEKVIELPVMTWQYKENHMPGRHMGVMAQDFYQAFGLGNSDTSMGLMDPNGVAMAAIQGLNRKVDQKNDEITSLKAKNQKLEERLAALEALVNKLADQ